MESTRIKFGPGATRELGFELSRFSVKRVLMITDPVVSQLEPVQLARESIQTAGIDTVFYSETHVEPTDVSFQDAIRVAKESHCDGFVAVGGGSSIDTAKAANLYSTYPAELLTYVNQPVGEGKPVPGPLKPLVAIPTTAGTGSETTGVAIFDYTAIGAKTGIAHPALRPNLGIVDPDNARTLSPMVKASTGLDVLSHAIESYTALPFQEREAPLNPGLRPAYQGANPISDLWAEHAIKLTADYLVRSVQNPDDEDARTAMMLAATFAGYGFGNAGVHLPHGMSYPVSSMVANRQKRHDDYHPDGYPRDHPILPHGISVILNAPAVFRFTSAANPDRHLKISRVMGVDVSSEGNVDAGNILADAIIDLMRAVNMPSGLAEVGFTVNDIPALVEGTLPQHRVTKLSPRIANKADLYTLFSDAMCYW